MDALLLAILHQIILEKERMRFDLIDFGFDTGSFDNAFEVLYGEIRDADVLDLPGLLKIDEGFPGSHQ